MTGLLLILSAHAAPWAIDEAPTLNGLLPAGTADIDADGFIDLVGLVDEDVAWSRGPAFVAPVVIADTDTRVLGLVDVDGDGDVDFVGGQSELHWYENLGGGAVARGQRVGSTTFEQIVDIYVLDLEGDGDDDLLVRDAWNSVFRVENLGGSFAAPVVEAVPVIVVAIGDLSGDGLSDLVVLEKRDILVVSNLGSGFDTPAPACTGYLTPVVLTDFDLDGDLDILAGDVGTVHWCANNGDGTFEPPVLLEDVGMRVHDLAAADLDGDLDPDVVMIDGDDHLRVRNNAGGVLSGDIGDVVTDTFNSVSSLTVGRYDLDRAADLAILSNEYDLWGYQTSPRFRFLWNPGFDDADGDGLSDDAEAHFGTDPYNVDSDGDGVWDYDQLAALPGAAPTLPLDTGTTGDTGLVAPSGHTGSTEPTEPTSDTGEPSAVDGSGAIAESRAAGTDTEAENGCRGCRSGAALDAPFALLSRRRPRPRQAPSVHDALGSR